MSSLSVLSCWYEVYLNGTPLPFEVKQQIESLSVTDSASGCSTAVVVINDLNFEFVDDDIFVEDVPVRIEGGWNECMHTWDFDGYIAAIDPDFGEMGYPVLTLHLMDATYLMNREPKYKTWEDVTSEDVVKEIAGEYGFSVEIYPEGYEFAREEMISQSDMTDIQFLRQLADRESDLFVVCLKGDRKTLYYGIRGVLTDSTLDLWYRTEKRNIMSFRPQITRESVPEQIERMDIDPQYKEKDDFLADTDTSERETQGDPVVTSSDSTSGGSQDGQDFNLRTGGWTSQVR